MYVYSTSIGHKKSIVTTLHMYMYPHSLEHTREATAPMAYVHIHVLVPDGGLKHLYCCAAVKADMVQNQLYCLLEPLLITHDNKSVQ